MNWHPDECSHCLIIGKYRPSGMHGSRKSPVGMIKTVLGTCSVEERRESHAHFGQTVLQYPYRIRITSGSLWHCQRECWRQRRDGEKHEHGLRQRWTTIILRLLTLNSGLYLPHPQTYLLIE